MRKLLIPVLLFCGVALAVSCGRKAAAADPEPEFVTLRDGNFYIGDSLYKYVGTNFWYGAILASEGRGGNRELLTRELDLMQANGIDNLRILVGADGDENVPHHVMPVLQTEPGVYNDTILDGLDYLMAELEKRGMKAVLYLNNAWEWSGGFGTYLEWAGAGKCPDPTDDGYNNYVDFVAQFVCNDSAKAMAADNVRFIVGRTNRYTGKPYSQSPALMTWEIANEPRPFASDSTTKANYAAWLADQAALIKSIDPNHLVSTGSEGLYGSAVDIDLWEKVHTGPDIDYGIIHLWPFNWRWVDKENLVAGMDSVCAISREYIDMHARIMARAGRPLVIEEFGYPRDGKEYAAGTSTAGRDAFYRYIFSLVEESDVINGCNFWGWGGYAQPAHEQWQPWDDYTCDPAHEPQGLYCVFASDSTTLAIIRNRGK